MATLLHKHKPGRVALSVGHLTRKSGVLGSIPVWPHTFVSPSADSRGAVVIYWRKYMHEILVNRLGGPSLSRKSVVRLTDRPDMTLDVYRGRKITTQQQQQQKHNCEAPQQTSRLGTVSNKLLGDLKMFYWIQTLVLSFCSGSKHLVRLKMSIQSMNQHREQTNHE